MKIDEIFRFFIEASNLERVSPLYGRRRSRKQQCVRSVPKRVQVAESI
jgi:hypothetical protein